MDVKPTLQVKLLEDSKYFKTGDIVNWYDTLGLSLAHIGRDGKFEYVELSAIAYQPKMFGKGENRYG